MKMNGEVNKKQKLNKKSLINGHSVTNKKTNKKAISKKKVCNDSEFTIAPHILKKCTKYIKKMLKCKNEISFRHLNKCMYKVYLMKNSELDVDLSRPRFRQMVKLACMNISSSNSVTLQNVSNGMIQGNSKLIWTPLSTTQKTL